MRMFGLENIFAVVFAFSCLLVFLEGKCLGRDFLHEKKNRGDECGFIMKFKISTNNCFKKIVYHTRITIVYYCIYRTRTNTSLVKTSYSSEPVR
jgi:hypothetical protein